MAQQVIIKFRDGTTQKFPPDSMSGVVYQRGYQVSYENGVLHLIEPYDTSHTWPLDLIESVTEVPQARF